MQNGELTVPVYMGYSAKDKKEKKDSKYADKEEDARLKRLLRDMGLLRPEHEEDERDDWLWQSMVPGYAPRGLEKSLGNTPMYMMPQSMTGRMPAYSQMGMNPASQNMHPMQSIGPPGVIGGYGQTAQISIQYNSPDGTTYQMGVSTTPENRGKALYNVLSGLYGLMMAEDGSSSYGKQGSKYGRGGKPGGKGYSGGKGGGGK